jgi:hypothetical protein
MQQKLKKIALFMLKSLGFVVLFLLLVLMLLRIPYVQNRLANLAVNWVAELTDTTISIDKISINFIDNVSIKGIYVEDMQGDTLLYAGKLSVDIALFKLLRKEIFLDEILLENAVANVYQHADSTFSFQFLIDAFATDDSKTEKESEIDFDIKKVKIKNLQARFDLLNASNTMQLGLLEIVAEKNDFNQLNFNVKSVQIDQLNLASIWQAELGLPQPEIVDSVQTAIDFPLRNLPVSIKVKNLSISETNLLYQKGEIVQSEHFNPNDITIKDLNIKAGNIDVNSQFAALQSHGMAFNLNNQIYLNNFSGNLHFSDEEAFIQNLQMATSKSQLELSTSIHYNTFEKLLALDPNAAIDLNLQNTHIEMDEVFYFIPLADTLPYLSNLKGKHVDLEIQVDGKTDNLDVKMVRIGVDETFLMASGNIQNTIDWEQMNFNNLQLKISTTAQDVREILGEEIIPLNYDKLGKVDLNLQASGMLNDLSFQSLRLNTSGALKADFSGKVKNLTDIDKLSFDVNIKKISGSFSDIEIFVDSLPDMLQQFEKIAYKGKLKGDLHDFKLKGKATTSLGDALTNFSIKFNQDYSDAAYKGAVSLIDFQLGKLLQTDSLGAVSLQANVKGKGLNLENLDASIDAIVQSIVFNSYEYNDIAIKGNAKGKSFDGKIQISDENLEFEFEGVASLIENEMEAFFEASLTKFDAQALRLTNFPLNVALQIQSNFKGKDLNDIDGFLQIKDIAINNDWGTWYEDSITISTKPHPDFINNLELHSSFLKSDFKGNFSYENLPAILISFADKYLPVSEIFQLKTTQDFLLSNESFEFNFELSKPDELIRFFNVNITDFDTANFRFFVDPPSQQLQAELYVPQLRYSGILFDSIYLLADGMGDKLDLLFQIDSISIAENIYVPGYQFSAALQNQKGEIKNLINNTEGGFALALTTAFEAANSQLLIHVKEPLIFDDTDWKVSQSEALVVSLDSMHLSNFILSYNNQKLEFSKISNIYALNFSNFALQNFANLVEIDSADIAGVINGSLSLNNENEHLLMEGNLSIKDILLNDNNLGDFMVNATQSGKNSDVKISLKGNDNDISAKAIYHAETGVLNGDFLMSKFQLATIQPFVNSFAAKVSGEMYGNVKLGGTIKELETQGELGFKKVGALVKAAGTYYSIGSGKVKIETGKMLPDLILNDEIGKAATLSGVVLHKNFMDYELDLRLSTQEFTFLNAEASNSDYFYGKMVAGANLTVSGPIDLPKIRGKISVLDNTDLTVQLLSPKAMANQETFILFFDGSDFSHEDADSIIESMYRVGSSIDLNVNLDISDKALFRVVIDPITGDNLEINGSGQLNLRISPAGAIDINGLYTVSKGGYRFSFQRLMRKRFEIVPGSQIVFAGNPLNARFDLRAAYNTEASALPLVQNELSTLSQDEQQALRRRRDVSVLLIIKGNLSEPIISFDIVMPESSGAPVGGSVSQALSRIRQNESELNKQVFSLLLFNSFTGASSSANISSTGNTAAFRSVGNLINNQLNKLAGNAEGLQLNFDLDQYQDQLGTTDDQITDIDFGVSQSLFNDRLVISVGGNVNLESGQEQGTSLGNVAGDFVLEYKLTSDGRYVVKVFQKSDYNAFNDANVWRTGVGFSYQTKFGKINKKRGTK